MAGLPSREYGIASEVIADNGPLMRGDQIAVSGSFIGEDYYHHGIYLGGGRVANVGGDDKKDAKPKIVRLEEFTGNGRRRLFRINYMRGECLPCEKSACIAERFVQNPNCWGPYSALRNNCEHFATGCKTGYAASKQVSDKVIECIKNPAKVIKYFLILADVRSNSAEGFTSK